MASCSRTGGGAVKRPSIKPWLLLLTMVTSPGCTAVALKQATLAHANSAMDLRYREVVENLAISAASPHTLPAYSSIYAGTTDVNDNLRATSATIWVRAALTHPLRYVQYFSTQSADFIGSRAVKSNWTLDPAIAPEKLRAMRAACRWMTQGVENVGSDMAYLMPYQPPVYGPYDVRLFPTGSVDPTKHIMPDGPWRRIDILEGTDRITFRVYEDNQEVPAEYTFVQRSENQEEFAKFKTLFAEKGPTNRLTATQKNNITALLVEKTLLYFGGPVLPHHDSLVLLEAPTAPGYYFDVAERLAELPPDWLHHEKHRRDVPMRACYWAGCGDHYVWVGAEGMAALSDLVLVMQEIARVQLASAYYPRPQTRTIQTVVKIDKNVANFYGIDKAVATVYLDENGVLTTGQNATAIPLKKRIDNVGQNSDLRSVINASVKSAMP